MIFFIIMQVLFFKIDFFFIPKKGMHTYTFLKWANVVWPAVLFYMLCRGFIVKKKKPLLKRILDGSRKFKNSPSLDQKMAAQK